MNKKGLRGFLADLLVMWSRQRPRETVFCIKHPLYEQPFNAVHHSPEIDWIEKPIGLADGFWGGTYVGTPTFLTRGVNGIALDVGVCAV